MNGQETIRGMAEANPVPDAGHLHRDPVDAERLFSSIERRRDEMIGTRTRQTPTQPPARPPLWYRRPAVSFLIAVAFVLVAAVPLVLFTGGGSEVIETPDPTTPASEVAAPATQTTVPATPTTLPTTPTTTAAPVTTLAGTVQGGGYLWKPAGFVAGQISSEWEIPGVAHTGSVFVVVGNDRDCAQVWVSADGSQWIGAPAAGGSVAPPCRLVLRDVASNGTTSVAVGTHGTTEDDGYEDEATVIVSDNGYDWSHPDEYPWTPFGLGKVVTSVAASETGFVAAGSNIWFSADGRVWSEATAPPVEDIVDVATGPDGFFAIGYMPGSVPIFGQQWASANSVLHSPDGRTWSVVAQLAGNFKAGAECWVAGNAISFGPHGYVIAGDCTSEEAEVAYPSIWISEDGLAWSQVPYDETAFGEPAYITAIAADESGYLAAGWSLGETEDHATVWVSGDGVSWIRTELSGQGNSAIRAVATYMGTAVAVGHNEFQPAIWLGTKQ